jgi:hypothetical protein
MSNNALRFRIPRHVCPCGRRAIYFSRLLRRVRARKDHPLCSRCYRALLASTAARGLRQLAASLRQPAPQTV